jgi:hypothetical protein
MIEVKPESFTIDITGEITGKQYYGTFKVKPILTHAEQIQRDIFMRDILGPGSESAAATAKENALVFADLRVRVLDAPAFWQESRFGLDLYDGEIIGKIWEKTREAENSFRKSIKDKAEEAKKEIAKP